MYTIHMRSVYWGGRGIHHLLGFSGITKPSKAAATSQTGNGAHSGFCSNPHQEKVLHSQGSLPNSKICAIKNEMHSSSSPSPFAFKKEG